MAQKSTALPKACVVNLGCRVNRAESDWIEEEFVRNGCTLTEEEDADIVVVNTCGVTGEAQAKTRKTLRHASELPARPLVVACGCVAVLFPEELGALAENIVVVPSKLTVVSDALKAWQDTASVGQQGFVPRESDSLEDSDESNLNTDDEGRTLSSSARSVHSRLKRGVKVQDGCDNRCTYCIVWKARGVSRSVPLVEIEQRVVTALDEGACEIDLTGVNLGRFHGVDEHGHEMGLAELIDHVASLVRGRGIVRASSLEPQDVNEAVLQAMARNSDVVCAHLHLPVQAGSDATLARMARPYTAADFLALAKRARELMKGFSLTTDVICGFPGETHDEFLETLSLCQQARFSKMHVFRYSPRPGTPAAAFAHQVPADIARARAAQLRGLGEGLCAQDAQKRVGTTERVLIERVDETGAFGTSASFHRAQVVDANGAPLRAGLVNAKVIDAQDNGLLVCRLCGYVRTVQ